MTARQNISHDQHTQLSNSNKLKAQENESNMPYNILSNMFDDVGRNVGWNCFSFVCFIQHFIQQQSFSNLTRTNEPMDPRLLLQRSTKNNQRKSYIYIFEQDEDLFNPSLGNIYTICHF